MLIDKAVVVVAGGHLPLQTREVFKDGIEEELDPAEGRGDYDSDYLLFTFQVENSFNNYSF